MRAAERELRRRRCCASCAGSGRRVGRVGRAGIGDGRERQRPARLAVAGDRRRHRDLLHGILGERHAKRVADAVFEQTADADRALHAAVLGVAGLRDPDVERIARPSRRARLEARREQAIGLDRHLRVARLHAEDDIAKALVFANVEELERALDHAERGVAEAVHDAVGERAVVGADAQRAAELLAAPHQRPEARGGVLHLFAPIGVAVFADGKLLLVGEVARIDAHLLDVLGGDQRGVGREMDVGDERHGDPAPPQLAADLREVLGLLEGGRGDARDLAAGLHHALDLRDGRERIERVGRRHRLQAQRIRAADADVADADLEAGPAARPVDGADGGERHALSRPRSARRGARTRRRGATHRCLPPGRNPGARRPCRRRCPPPRAPDRRPGSGRRDPG